jgi:hypothetical protein
MGSGSGSIPRSRVSVEVTVDFQNPKPCLTMSDVETQKEEIMKRKHTYTIGIKTRVNLTMLLREKFIALIAVASLVFGFDGGMAPLTA